MAGGSKETRAKLTNKQMLFVREYLIDLNGTQAAIRAGYSPKTATEMSTENLRKPHIKAEIQKEMDARAGKLNITAEKVLEELAKMAFANMDDYVSVAADGAVSVRLNDLSRDKWAAVQEIQTEDLPGGRNDEGPPGVKVKFKLADKKANLELLGKHLKLFTENVNVNVSHEDYLDRLE